MVLFLVLVNCIMCYHLLRFHCPAREPSLDYDVILPLGDDIQLSVGEYRNKLYEVLNSVIFFYLHSPRLSIHAYSYILVFPISQFHTVVIFERLQKSS